jgi:hypothetical protein
MASEPKGRTKAIFIAVNGKFFAYTVIFLKNLRRNYPQHPDVVAYWADLSESELRWLSQFPRVRLVQYVPDPEMVGPAMATHRPKYADSKISYARFEIWTDAFKEYDQVLHLDTDTIVLAPLDDLIDREGFTIFAESHQNPNAIFKDRDNPELLAKLKADGITPPAIHANFGVFCISRRHRTVEEYKTLKHLIQRYGAHFMWADQSLINVWLGLRGIPISQSREFNYQHRFLMQKHARQEMKNAKIFHLNGVDHTYRLFLMRAAVILFRMPFGVSLYVALFVTLDRALRYWRRAKK